MSSKKIIKGAVPAKHLEDVIDKDQRFKQRKETAKTTLKDNKNKKNKKVK